MPKKKQIEVIDMAGKKTVAKKKSFIKTIKIIFAIFTVLWLGLVAWFPMHVKDKYSNSIKEAMVVSLVYDLQNSISQEYNNMLKGIKDSINIEKPINAAIDKVKVVEGSVNKVTDATAKAKNQTNKIKNETNKVASLSGVANKFGVKTDGLNKAIAKTNDIVAQADSGIAKADAVVDQVNKKLDSVKTELVKASKIEIDKVIDEEIQKQNSKSGGVIGFLTKNYKGNPVRPWDPSTWKTAHEMYGDMKGVDFVKSIINTVNQYFGYVAWGLVALVWLIGLLVWLMVKKRVKLIVSPFIVCPRCGHTFSDKRTIWGVLRIFQPWKWF